MSLDLEKHSEQLQENQHGQEYQQKGISSKNQKTPIRRGNWSN